MKKIIITALCLTTSAVIFILQLNKPTPTSLTIDQNFSTDFAYDNKQFLIGVAGGQLNTEKDLPSLDTLIIPHHLTASTLMAEGIYQLATKTNPKIIVVLSPNHADIGGCPVITSFKGWSTPFGVVSPDSRIIGQLLTSNLICTDDNNLGVEHGIATLLPFIKYYLPNARIVPLAFKRNISLEDLQKVSEKIYKISNLSVIASIDFSHGLPPSESKSKDEETLNLINEQDISRIANLSSQYLDSPPALITLMNINKLRNNKQVLITHADAASVSQKDNDNDTSYYVIGYYPQDSRKNWTLIATGDVMLGRSVNTQSVKKNDYTWAFKNIAHLLKSADITLINLESPLTEDCRPTDEGMTFCGKAENVQGLVYSGVDVANIANNHIYNQGLLGLDQTITVLNNNNISPVGIGHISVKDIGGTQAAFIGFDTTTKQDNTQIIQSITDLKKQYPLVIVSFHWGSEYQSKPNQKQVATAHLAVDSGADVVIGNHPHWIQTEEIYKNKHIYYSLGNLVFDQMWSTETEKGMIIRLNFQGKDLISVNHFPVTIYDYGQPKLDNVSTNELAPISLNP